MRARIAHDVINRQKVARIVELFDQRQFVIERGGDLFGNAVRVARLGALPCEALQFLLRRRARPASFFRIFVAQLI